MPDINGIGDEMQIFMVHGSRFAVEGRYIILEAMGQGAYGVVCSAQDKLAEQTGEEGCGDCAVKKIENVFEEFTYAKRTLRELRILRLLRHENIINVENIFLSGSKEDFEDIYVVSELMETDLTSILKSDQAISDDHCQFFLYQILRGMKYIHSAGVIHRDLKPRNLLVNSNCDLKICDFGLARLQFDDPEYCLQPMTEYVCTRWYRAPEVLFAQERYDVSIDVWSIGCIFAEMLGRRPIFAGNNTQHQLQLIVQQIGPPTAEDFELITNQKCKEYLQKLCEGDCQAKDWGTTYPEASAKAVALLAEMMPFSPTTRATVGACLAHPYLGSLSCPEDEPIRDPIANDDFEFERRKVDVVCLRDELFSEMLKFHPMVEWPNPLQNAMQFRLLEAGEAQEPDDDDD